MGSRFLPLPWSRSGFEYKSAGCATYGVSPCANTIGGESGASQTQDSNVLAKTACFPPTPNNNDVMTRAVTPSQDVLDALVMAAERCTARGCAALSAVCSNLKAAEDAMWRALFVRDFAHLYAGHVCARLWSDTAHRPNDRWSPSQSLFGPTASEHVDSVVDLAVRAQADSAKAVLDECSPTRVPAPFAGMFLQGKTWKWLYRAHAVGVVRDDRGGGRTVGSVLTGNGGLYRGDIDSGVASGYGVYISFDAPTDANDRDDLAVSAVAIRETVAAVFIDGRPMADILCLDAHSLCFETGWVHPHTVDRHALDADAWQELCAAFMAKPYALLGDALTDATQRAHQLRKSQGPVHYFYSFAVRDGCAFANWAVTVDGAGVSVRRGVDDILSVCELADDRIVGRTSQCLDGVCRYTYDREGRYHGASVSTFVNGDTLRVMYDRGHVAQVLDYAIADTCSDPAFAGRRIASNVWREHHVPMAESRDKPLCRVLWPIGDTDDVRLFWRYVRQGLVGWHPHFVRTVLDVVDRNAHRLPYDDTFVDPLEDTLVVVTPKAS